MPESNIDIEEYIKFCDKTIDLVMEANKKLNSVAFQGYIRFIKQLLDGMTDE